MSVKTRKRAELAWWILRVHTVLSFHAQSSDMNGAEFIPKYGMSILPCRISTQLVCYSCSGD